MLSWKHCVRGSVAVVSFIALSMIAVAQNFREHTDLLAENEIHIPQGSLSSGTRSTTDSGMNPAEMRVEKLIVHLTRTATQQAALETMLEAQQDPNSTWYHQWLSPQQFGEQYGVSAENLQAVTAWIKANHLHVDEIAAGKNLLLVSGTVSQVEAAFHLTVNAVQENGAVYLTSANEAQIPTALAASVDGLVGLEKNHLSSTTQINASGSSNATQIASLSSLGLTGKDVTVAVVGRSSVSAADVAAFRQAMSFPTGSIQILAPYSKATTATQSSENMLPAVEWVSGVAAEAGVSLIAQSNTTAADGVNLALQYAVNHASAQVLSVPWSGCEAAMSAAERNFYNDLWQQAAAEGLSVLVAAGNSGASSCSSDTDSTATTTSINALCSSAWATCVGGIQIESRSGSAVQSMVRRGILDGAAISEVVMPWNESSSNSVAATGGGVSHYVQQPAWQSAVSGAKVADGMRAVPDVSALAASTDGYLVVQSGQRETASGTALATSTMAGLAALLVQKNGGSVGNLNAALYAMSKEAESPFTAVERGNNSVQGVEGYTADGADYSPAAGLGAVNAARLLAAWEALYGKSTQRNFSILTESDQTELQTGETKTLRISLLSNGNNRSAVTLSAKTPAGVQITFADQTLLPGSSTTATIHAGSASATGTSSIALIASNATGTQSTTHALTVTQSPTLTLATSASTLTVKTGASAAITIGVKTTGSYTGNVTFTVSGLPSGVTTAIGSNPLTGLSGATAKTTTLTLTATSTATAATSTITIVASGDGLISKQTLALTVKLAPTLVMANASTTMSAIQGNSISNVITLTANSVFSGTVTLSVSGLPTGVTAKWSTNPVTLSSLSGSTTLTLQTTSSAAASTTSVLITATGGGLTVTKTVSLTVTTTPTLVMTLASSTMSVTSPVSAVTPAQMTTSQTITLTGGGSYAGAVTLSISGLPSYVTGTFSNSSVTLNSSLLGTSVLTLTTSESVSGAAISTVAPGTWTVTVTATGDGLTVTQSVVVQVQGMVVTPAATTLSITRGTSSTLSFTTAMGGGVSGVVKPGILASGTPSGVTIALDKSYIDSPGNGTFTATITAESDAPVGTYLLVPASALVASSSSTTPTLLAYSGSQVILNIVP